MEGIENRPQPRGTQLPADILERGTVAGLFTDEQSAERAIVDLDANGFSLDNLGVAMHESRAQQELISDTGTQTVQEAAQGGTGIIGSVVNLLRRPEALSGENLIAVLASMGIPEGEARHFEGGVAVGGALVTVQVRGVRTQEALDILLRHGADLGFAVEDQDTVLPIDYEEAPQTTSGWLDLQGR